MMSMMVMKLCCAGILPGNDEGDDFKHFFLHEMSPSHFYSSSAEAYRAFSEIGRVWAEVGQKTGREDVAQHGTMLMGLSEDVYQQLHASLNKTVNTTQSPVCWLYRQIL